MAQAPADMLNMTKEALGLGKKTPESEANTGIPNGVPFIVRFRDTVGDLEAGADVLLRGMTMGTVKEVKITFDAAHARFDIPVTIELDPGPFVAGSSQELVGESRTLVKDTQPLVENLTDTLDQIGEAARSMRALSDMLERQPEAILRGKGR